LIWENAAQQLMMKAPADLIVIWRKRVRVEHTLDRANLPSAGFEDREDHRIPFASAELPTYQVISCAHDSGKSPLRKIC
jgi:hypothetical protein